MNNQLTKTTNELLNKMTPKQNKFFVLWLKTGNGTKSAMEAYDCKDETIAASVASQNLTLLKNPMKTFLESNGLSISHLSKVLIEAMGATKWNDFTGEREPDHKIRMESVDRLGKWLDVEPKDETPIQQQNIQINVTRGEE